MAARFETLLAGGFPYFVAEEDGGVARLCLCRSVPAAAGLSLHRRGFGLCRARRQGPGHRQAVARSADRRMPKQLGFRQMIAVIGDGSPTAPRSSCTRSSGFRHCGVLEGSGYKHGRWLDTTFMQLSMNGGTRRATRSGVAAGAASFEGRTLNLRPRPASASCRRRRARGPVRGRASGSAPVAAIDATTRPACAPAPGS